MSECERCQENVEWRFKDVLASMADGQLADVSLIVCRNCHSLFNDDGVAEYSRHDEGNEIYRIHERSGAPIVRLRKRRKYAVLDCDFITTSRNARLELSDSALDEITSLFEEYYERACDDDKHKQFPISITKDKQLLIFDALRLPVARELASDVAEVVYNRDNLEVVTNERE